MFVHDLVDAVDVLRASRLYFVTTGMADAIHHILNSLDFLIVMRKLQHGLLNLLPLETVKHSQQASSLLLCFAECANGNFYLIILV